MENLDQNPESEPSWTVTLKIGVTVVGETIVQAASTALDEAYAKYPDADIDVIDAERDE